MFLKAVKHSRDNNKLNCVSEIDNPFNDKNWQAGLISVELIFDRFDLIAHMNSFDIITKYKRGIIHCYTECFPEQDETTGLESE